MTASELYRDCFWCGKVYDFWRHDGCPRCGSKLETDGLGSLAGDYNKRPDYVGPDLTDALEARQAISEAYYRRFGGIFLY
jgi:hypothetical protein